MSFPSVALLFHFSDSLEIESGHLSSPFAWCWKGLHLLFQKKIRLVFFCLANLFNHVLGGHVHDGQFATGV